MGCALASSLVARVKDFCRNLAPDFLFVEPSEMVVTRELRNVSAMGLRDVTYEIGPFITLVDGPAFEFTWKERRALLLGQIGEADVVAVSRADLLDAEQLDRVTASLKPHSSGVFELSALEGRGLEEVVAMIN